MPIGFTRNVFLNKIDLCRRSINELFCGSVDARLCLSGDNVVSMLMEANSFRYVGVNRSLYFRTTNA